jgi:hypothetical protein
MEISGIGKQFITSFYKFRFLCGIYHNRKEMLGLGNFQDIVVSCNNMIM